MKRHYIAMFLFVMVVILTAGSSTTMAGELWFPVVPQCGPEGPVLENLLFPVGLVHYAGPAEELAALLAANPGSLFPVPPEQHGAHPVTPGSAVALAGQGLTGRQERFVPLTLAGVTVNGRLVAPVSLTKREMEPLTGEKVVFVLPDALPGTEVEVGLLYSTPEGGICQSGSFKLPVETSRRTISRQAGRPAR